MKINAITIATVSFISLLHSSEAGAHVAYIDLFQSENQTVNVDGSTTYNTVFPVKSNGAWANAASETGGENHSTPWYKFDIANPQGAIVDLSLTRVNEFGGLDIVKDFTPAFSLYKGLVPPASHLGVWYALGDTTLENEQGESGTIQYLTHAGTVGSQLDTVSLKHFFLDPGSYTIALGGSCYECFPHYERLDPENPNYDPDYENHLIEIENDAQLLRAFELGLTLHPVPIPATIWLMGSTLLGLIGLTGKRKKQS